jgi:adenylyl-sulfate kinase
MVTYTSHFYDLENTLVIDKTTPNIVLQEGHTARHERQKLLGQLPLTIWLTGLSAAGKSTLGFLLERQLIDAGHPCFVLDGDNVRQALSRDLGFSDSDRTENIRRIAEVAKLMNDAGLIVITAFISPLESDREMAKKIIGEEQFREVYVSTSIEVCESRDPKGLYKKARAGLLKDFTGISAPYEVPPSPRLILDTGVMSQEACLESLMGLADSSL